VSKETVDAMRDTFQRCPPESTGRASH
jgi:hypothetical protein